MKTSKQLEPTRITDRREYADELAKLNRLNSALETASKRLEALTSRRPSEEVGRYLGKWPNPMAGVPEAVLEQMAGRIAAEGEIDEQLAKRLHLMAIEVPLPDKYDRETVEQIFEVDRGVRLFKRAIELQSKRVLEQKNLAMAEVRDTARPERQRIARTVAASALALIHAVQEENAFLERLKSQDEALPAMVGPSAFPIALHPESAVCSWLALALEVSEAEVQNLITNPRLQSAGAATGRPQ